MLEAASNKQNQGAFHRLAAATHSRKRTDIQVGTQASAGMVYVKDSKSILTTDREAMERRWHEYYSGIFSEASTLSTYNRPGAPEGGTKEDGIGLEPSDFMPTRQPIATHLDNPFTDEENDKALEKGKEGTSTGKDALPNEFLKRASHGAFRTAALATINRVLEDGTEMPEWRDCVIVPVHKPKKSKLSCDSYRPVSLVNHFGKYVERLIFQRLLPYVMSIPDCIPDTQCGGMPSLGTVDAIHVTRPHCLVECT
jgi:hypothetical protein